MRMEGTISGNLRILTTPRLAQATPVNSTTRRNIAPSKVVTITANSMGLTTILQVKGIISLKLMGDLPQKGKLGAN